MTQANTVIVSSAPPPPSPPPLHKPTIFFSGSRIKAAKTLISPNETSIFLDWDDTCIASDWMRKGGLSTRTLDEGYVNPAFLEAAELISVELESLLLSARELGRVFIVTNGTDGWVEMSCNLFMPKLLPLVTSFPIISAQDRYKAYYTSPVDWKRMTFRDILDASARPGRKLRNLISIGDGMAEYIASQSLKEYSDRDAMIPNIIKSVKLQESPTPEQLAEELRMLGQMFPKLVHHSTDADLKVSVSYYSPLPESDSDSDSEPETKKPEITEPVVTTTAVAETLMSGNEEALEFFFGEP